MFVIVRMTAPSRSRLGILRHGPVPIMDDEGPALTLDMLEVSCLTLWYERDAFRELFPEEVMQWLENEFQVMHDSLHDLEDWRVEMESLPVSSVLPRGLQLEFFDP